MTTASSISVWSICWRTLSVKGEGSLLDEETLARDGLDDALGLQLGISLGDRIAVDAQFLGQGAEGGQGVTGAQSAGGGGVTDLVGQLEIDRLAGLEIYLKDHALILLYNTMTVRPRRVN